VRRGLLILVPENIKVLGGGLVKQLDEEVLKEVLKPVVDDPSHSSSTLNITDAVQASNQGKSLCSRLDYINTCVRQGVYTYDVTNQS
jgi:hypothetical protein